MYYLERLSAIPSGAKDAALRAWRDYYAPRIKYSALGVYWNSVTQLSVQQRAALTDRIRREAFLHENHTPEGDFIWLLAYSNDRVFGVVAPSSEDRPVRLFCRYRTLMLDGSARGSIVRARPTYCFVLDGVRYKESMDNVNYERRRAPTYAAMTKAAAALEARLIERGIV